MSNQKPKSSIRKEDVSLENLFSIIEETNKSVIHYDDTYISILQNNYQNYLHTLTDYVSENITPSLLHAIIELGIIKNGNNDKIVELIKSIISCDKKYSREPLIFITIKFITVQLALILFPNLDTTFNASNYFVMVIKPFLIEFLQTAIEDNKIKYFKSNRIPNLIDSIYKEIRNMNFSFVNIFKAINDSLCDEEEFRVEWLVKSDQIQKLLLSLDEFRSESDFITFDSIRGLGNLASPFNQLLAYYCDKTYSIKRIIPRPEDKTLAGVFEKLIIVIDQMLYNIQNNNGFSKAWLLKELKPIVFSHDFTKALRKVFDIDIRIPIGGDIVQRIVYGLLKIGFGSNSKASEIRELAETVCDSRFNIFLKIFLKKGLLKGESSIKFANQLIHLLVDRLRFSWSTNLDEIILPSEIVSSDFLSWHELANTSKEEFHFCFLVFFISEVFNGLIFSGQRTLRDLIKYIPILLFAAGSEEKENTDILRIVNEQFGDSWHKEFNRIFSIEHESLLALLINIFYSEEFVKYGPFRLILFEIIYNLLGFSPRSIAKSALKNLTPNELLELIQYGIIPLSCYPIFKNNIYYEYLKDSDYKEYIEDLLKDEQQLLLIMRVLKWINKIDEEDPETIVKDLLSCKSQLPDATPKDQRRFKNFSTWINTRRYEYQKKAQVFIEKTECQDIDKTLHDRDETILTAEISMGAKHEYLLGQLPKSTRNILSKLQQAPYVISIRSTGKTHVTKHILRGYKNIISDIEIILPGSSENIVFLIRTTAINNYQQKIAISRISKILENNDKEETTV